VRSTGVYYLAEGLGTEDDCIFDARVKQASNDTRTWWNVAGIKDVGSVTKNSRLGSIARVARSGSQHVALLVES